MIPQLLLGNVLFGAGVDADDPRLVRQRFDRPGVVVADRLIDHPAGDQIDPADVIVTGESLGEVNDILGLAAGVGVAAKLEVMATDQAVDTDQHQVFRIGVFRHELALGGGCGVAWYYKSICKSVRCHC